MDGTLVDTREQHWRSWREAMAQVDVIITERQFSATFGQRNDAILTWWVGERATPDFVERVGGDKEQRFRDFVRQEGVVVLPGVAEWVERLHVDGWLQAIASSAPRANVEVTWHALRFASLLAAAVSAEDVTRGKPDPEVFLVAASRLGVEPARCVVVEDAVAGIEAAQRAGMRSIGVGDNVGTTADVTVASLAELKSNAFEGLLASG
jgi:beta-phosphoglucomutase